MGKKERKEWIDNATYEQLLSHWRFAPVGSPWFQGEIGDYYDKVMKKRGKEAGSEERVKASKNIGW